MELSVAIVQPSKIAYKWIPPAAPNIPSIMYLPGLCSTWTGLKGGLLEATALTSDLGYLTLHYQGHGVGNLCSSGSIDEVKSLQEWIDGIVAVLAAADAVGNSPPLSKLIIVGSSLGAWLGLHIALLFPERIAALVLVAPAVDATQRWAQEGMASMSDETFIEIPSAYVPEGSIQLRRELLQDAKSRFLLLEGLGRERLASLTCPVHILHGELDDVVPLSEVQRLAAAFTTAELEVVPGGDHRLSRDEDLQRLEVVVRRMIGLCQGDQVGTIGYYSRNLAAIDSS